MNKKNKKKNYNLGADLTKQLFGNVLQQSIGSIGDIFKTLDMKKVYPSRLQDNPRPFNNGGPTDPPAKKKINYGDTMTNLGREPFIGDIINERIVNPKFGKGNIEFNLKGQNNKTVKIPTTEAKARIPLDAENLNRMLTSISSEKLQRL